MTAGGRQRLQNGLAMPYDLMSRCCDQCLMTDRKVVSDARRKQIVQQTLKEDCAFFCHKGSMVDRNIACRGHFDSTGGGQMARIAGRLGCIREIDPETLERAQPMLS